MTALRGGMLSASVQNKDINLGNPPENLLFLICMKWQFHWNRLIEMDALHIDLCFYCQQLGTLQRGRG